MQLKHYGLAFLVVLTFGINFPLTKLGVEEIPPLFLSFLRFALVAIVLLPLAKPPPRDLWRPLLGFSLVLGVFHFSLMFTAMQYVDASEAAILVQVQVPFSALLAAIFFNDRLGWRRALGMVIALIGVVILIGEPQGTSPLWASAMVIVAVMAWSISNIQAKRLESLGVVTLNAYLSAVAVPCLLILALFIEGPSLDWVEDVTWVGMVSALYQAFGVVIFAYGIWYTLLKRFDVNQLVPLTLLVPVLGVGFSMLMLGEELTTTRLVGGATTIIGVAIIVIRRPGLAQPGTR